MSAINKLTTLNDFESRLNMIESRLKSIESEINEERKEDMHYSKKGIFTLNQDVGPITSNSIPEQKQHIYDTRESKNLKQYSPVQISPYVFDDDYGFKVGEYWKLSNNEIIRIKSIKQTKFSKCTNLAITTTDLYLGDKEQTHYLCIPYNDKNKCHDITNEYEFIEKINVADLPSLKNMIVSKSFDLKVELNPGQIWEKKEMPIQRYLLKNFSEEQNQVITVCRYGTLSFFKIEYFLEYFQISKNQSYDDFELILNQNFKGLI